MFLLHQEYYLYHCNHLRLPDALTDQAGNIAWAAEYDPWGNVQSEHNPHQLKQNIRLPGQYHDPKTGLYYNRHRYYDPALGSYINQDPIGLDSGEPNFYAYPTNPVQGADPLGLYQEESGIRNISIKKAKGSLFDIGAWGACQHDALAGMDKDNLQKSLDARLKSTIEEEKERFQNEYGACFNRFEEHEPRMQCVKNAENYKYDQIDAAQQRRNDYLEKTKMQQFLSELFCS